jgi:hypothetical protein
MATTAGSSGVFKISQTDGSEAQVVNVRSFSFDVTADTIENSVMGNTARTYVAGLSNSTLSIETYWDASDQVEFDERATVYWELYPTGTGTGEKYYHGSGVVTGKTVSAAFDGMVEASFAIQNSGAVTEATA